MAIDVQMPKLSDNMESGTIVRWLKKEGDSVAVGEPLAEVETDKADVELEASAAGVLREIRVAEGQSAAIGDVIAVLAADSESPQVATDQKSSATNAAAAGPDEEESTEPTAEEKPAAKAKETAAAQPSPSPAQASAAERPQSEAPIARDAKPAPRTKVRASPLAWRIAAEAGIDVSLVKGSGPGGRILKRDVETLVAQRKKEANTAPPPAPQSQAGGPDRRARAKAEAEQGGAASADAAGGNGARSRTQPASRMRQAIAQRMSEANREIPHFFVTTEIDMTEAWRLRQALKESGAVPTLTVTHVIVKAVALALSEHPLVNASWRDGAVEFFEDANIGLAVAVEDGLIVPVLHRAQELSLRDLSVRAQALTEKARTGRFGSQDLMGGTFSVSNLGILDVEQFTAIITPPQAAVLAIGTVKERPVVRNGALAIARTMYATLSCDHRVLNGVEGGEFLTEVKRLLESPYVLLMENS